MIGSHIAVSRLAEPASVADPAEDLRTCVDPERKAGGTESPIEVKLVASEELGGGIRRSFNGPAADRLTVIRSASCPVPSGDACVILGDP
jgi:hypothetical protein